MKIIKFILLFTVALLLLVIVGLVAAINLIDLNRHKDRIAQMVYDRTGRELQITGDLDWGFWPRLYLAGGPLTLGNAPGFGPEPFLSLEDFHLAVATRPLWRSEVIMDTVQMAGLRLNLARDQAGVGNWEDLTGPPTQAQPLPKPEKPAGPPFAALALGGVNITDAGISWQDAVSGQEAEIRDLSLRTGALTFGDPVQLELDFGATSKQPQMEVVAAVQGTVVYDLKAERYALQPLEARATFSGPTVPGGQAELNLHTLLDFDSRQGRAQLDEFRLEGLGALISARMEMHDLNEALPGCRGELTAEIADLVRLLNIFELPLGQQLAGVRERAVSLQTEFAVDPGRGQALVPRLEARLLGTTISGSLEAANIQSAQPDVRGAIKAEGPDLPALLAVAARFRPEADREALSRALTGLRNRGLLAEAVFASEGPDIVIPNLRLQALNSNLASDWRFRNLEADKLSLQGKFKLEGSDLPMLLRVGAAFAGEPDGPAGQEAGAHQELWALADRVATARQNSFELAAALTADLAQGQVRISDFSGRALGLAATAELAAQDIFTSPAFTMDLELPLFNARAVMPLLDVAVPETADYNALTRMALKTRISGSPAKFTFAPLELRLDDSLIQGQMVVNDLDSLDLAFKLEIDQIDLDRYLPPESAQQPVPPDAALAGAALLPVELLRELRLEGDLRAAKLKISGLQLENFSLGIKARDGRINLQPLDAALYGGRMSAIVSLDAGGEQPTIKAENSLSGIQAAPLLRDLTGDRERIRGRADISYNLETAGAEIEDLKANLNGETRFSFSDGAVVGVNIGRMLRQTSALIQGRTLVVEQREAVTDFTALTGSAQIKNGLVSNRDLNLMSPLLRATGAGTADLVSEQVDYLLTTTVVDTPEGQEGRELDQLRGIAVPVRISGTFAELSYRPDLSGAGLEQLQQNLRQLEQRFRQEGLRGLEGLFNGRPGETPAPADPEAAPEEAPAPQPEEKLQEELRRLFRF